MVRWIGLIGVLLMAMPALAFDAPKDSFTFGSYGRLVVGSDLEGGGLSPLRVLPTHHACWKNRMRSSIFPME